jgi:hypothetical protein
MSTTVQKEPPMERYSVHGDHGVWATIALRDYQRPNNKDDMLNGGEILINSDYGNYAYSWGNMGSPLKAFLCRINRSYVIDKLTNGDDTEFDFDASLAAARKEIRRMRKTHEITRAAAQEAMEDLPSQDDGQDEFIRQVWQMDLFTDGDPPSFFVRTRERPQITGFYDHVWTPFIAHLRTELADADAA